MTLLDKYKQFFPYPYIRPEQESMLKAINDGLEKGKNCIIEAPSGIGKTVASLTLLVPYAIENRLKVLYMCRTHTQMSRAVEELRKLRAKGLEFKAMMLRGKSDLCFLEQVRKLPYHRLIKACELMKRRSLCPYDIKMRLLMEQHDIEKLYDLKEGVLHIDDIVEMAVNEHVCAHELAFELLKYADVVVMSYLYIVNEELRTILLRSLEAGIGECILVFDEAHNVADVAMEVESVEVTKRIIEREIMTTFRAISIGKLPIPIDEKIKVRQMKYGILKGLKCMAKLMDDKCNSPEVEYSLDEFIYDFESRTGESFHSFIEYFKELRRLALRYSTYRWISFEKLVEFFDKVIEAIGDDRYVGVLSRVGDDVKYGIVCVDPKVALEPLLAKSYISIHMSATLSPMEHYAELVGLRNYQTFSIKPSYADRVITYIVSDVTTAYEMRTSEMYSKIGAIISTIGNNIDANIAVFFPSYEVLNKVSGYLKVGKRIFMEIQGEESRRFEEKIRTFKDQWKHGGALLLGVLGGRASEGTDYPGRTLEMVIIVGVPYPEPTVKVRAQRRYYARRYGNELAFTFSSVIPAMRKVNQAIGRLVRSPSDYGVVVLMDERYRRLTSYLPSWIRLAGEYTMDSLRDMLHDIVHSLESFRRS